MKRILLCALLAVVTSVGGIAEEHSLESDLFRHKRINLYAPGTTPGWNSEEHKDSIVNNRIWKCAEPRMYLYSPGLEERKRCAVIVIPGGGYIKQAYETGGVSLAKWLNTFGVTAFVLLHRLPSQTDLVSPVTTPVGDVQRAVKWIRAHSAEYGIDPDKIGVIGCSAGAHMAACANVADTDFSICGDSVDSIDSRPDFAILVSPAGKTEGIGESPRNMKGNVRKFMERFPVSSMVTGSTSPMLMIHASNDKTVSPLNSVELYKALLNEGVNKSSLHVFPFGGHSISLRNQPGSTAVWPDIAEDWMREIGVLE